MNGYPGSGSGGGSYRTPSHYSPTAPYNEVVSYPPPLLPHDFPPFPPPGAALAFNPPAPPTWRPQPPFDNYQSDTQPSGPPPRSYAYEQPHRSFEQDVYDPYQPSAYDPVAPQLRGGPPPSTYPSKLPPPPPSLPPVPTKAPAHQLPLKPGEAVELTLLTAPTTVTIGTFTGAIYSLPQSHLPITKYVSVNPSDAVDLHRTICQSGMTPSIWYADGSTRAGEGWAAAVEWNIDTGMSGSKMRTCVGNNDALGTELGAILKSVEGFRDSLQQSIKTQKPMSHEFVLFTDSPAAIVSIDTSSRPESLKFCDLWREICSDFLQAHMTLIWIPKGSEIEGFVLADKIATVAASNSYLRRRKDRTIDSIYNRPGGGDTAPSGSTEGGPWQRGDADPSRRKTPFERPKALPAPPVLPSSLEVNDIGLGLNIGVDPEPEDEGLQPRSGALCVSNFPDQASAKDLGILFAQFGDITSVDIFSIPPVKPRFAFVAYAEPDTSVAAAVKALHRRPVLLDTPFASDNAQDLTIWKGWAGNLTVVKSDPNRLVPMSIAHEFPELPEYATCDRRRSATVDGLPHKANLRAFEDNVKRLRESSVPDELTPPTSSMGSPSPKKRMRPLNAANYVQAEEAVTQVILTSDSHPPSRAATAFNAGSHPLLSSNVLKKNSSSKPLTTDNALDSSIRSGARVDYDIHTSHVHPYPPTPLTAQRVQNTTDTLLKSPPHPPALEMPSINLTASPSKQALTNSAAEPQEFPIKLSGSTLNAQISLVKKVFVKHDPSNWIAHTCLIATDLDQSRRQLQADLYATDEAFITGRELEHSLTEKGFTPPRVDAFITKVLKVLDGIALADEMESGGGPPKGEDNLTALKEELSNALQHYPEQTREAMAAAGVVLEYLQRGREAQEKKRLDVERRVKVLEGMAKIGEQTLNACSWILDEGDHSE